MGSLIKNIATLSSLTALSILSQAAPVFPVQYSANHRYLVDQNNIPFPIMGRTAWFVTALSPADSHVFIDDCAARGFSAIEFHVINHDPRGDHPPLDDNGNPPFLKRLDGTDWDGSFGYGDINTDAPDLTTPNDAYWSLVDGLLAYCESKGILVFMFPAYVGFGGDDQGWMQEIVANGPAKIESYGAWIATRYKDQKNVVWMMGGDMGTPPYPFDAVQTGIENALLTGLKSVVGQQSTLFSAEWTFESIATDQTSFGASMTLNGVYSFSGDVNTHGRRAYNYTPVEPAYLLEEPYDEEGPDGNNANDSAAQPVRRFQWWGWLSTIGGYISGNGYVWPFREPTWHEHLDTQGARDMARLNAFIGSIPWFKLVPSGLDGMRTLITDGGSTVNSSDYVSAAATPDGTLLVAYVPPAHNGPFLVDMGAMAGPSRARWFDPTSAAYTNIGTGLANSGSLSFAIPGNNSAGENDWVLLLDHTSPVPTISSITDQVTTVNTVTPAIPFTIGDGDTAVESLILSKTSSDLTLVPANNIVFGGSGTNRTVTVSPATNQTGSATITVILSDGFNTATQSFVLTVNSPFLSVVADNATRAHGQTNPVFTGTLSGVQNGDNITATYSSSATADSPPGVYEIVPTPLDPDGKLANYTVGVTNGILTVIIAPLISGIWESPPGSFIIECQVVAGRVYQAQYKNHLQETNWTILGTQQTATSLSLAITNDPSASPQRFYRFVDVTPP